MNTIPTASIDQAIDSFARIIQPTAASYYAYLQQLYSLNAEERSAEWHENDIQKESVLIETALRILETKNMRRSEMHIVLVGPGLKPMGSDITDLTARVLVKHLKQLTIVDFSTVVVSEAIKDVKSKIKNIDNRLAGMQFDVTNGFSSAHARVLKEAFYTKIDFDKMCEEAERLGDMDLAAVKEMLHDKWGKLSAELISDDTQIVTDTPLDWVSGHLNTNRTLELTSNEVPLKTDLWFMPMVVAGTGAASESEYIWSRHEEAISDLDQSNDEFQEKNKKFLSDIHKYIANYNTLVAAMSIQRIFDGKSESNKEATVLAVTDVSTIMNGSDETYPRLRLETLEKLLLAAEIKMEIRGGEWEWNDEPSHRHGVRAIVCRKIKKPKVNQSDDSVALVDTE